MLDNAYAVIMAGGKGERFWPLSTSATPKQVLSIVGDEPMLSGAIRRLSDVIPPERVLVITSADLVDAVMSVAPELPRENIVGEPFGRDTAAVCALASGMIKARDPEAVFCVLTADHVIKNVKQFSAVIEDSVRLAASESTMVTIGIPPLFPSTGFGYIETQDSREGPGMTNFLRARRFVEKPDAETARRYLESGSYFWNSGMFIWSVATLQSALKAHQPALMALAERMEAVSGTPEFDAVMAEEYGKLEKISIDYAIMEKADNIAMAKASFDWDDVGTWQAVRNHFEKDAAENVFVGACEQVDSDGNTVVSKHRLTALLGVSNLVVVQAEGATLVCAQDRVQDVKQLVALLRDKGCYEELL